MRTNYALIDYESVQPASIAVLEQECFKVMIYIGQLSTAEPDACFHIMPKDTGFDPLVAHLKTKRIEDIHAKTPADRVAAVLANLRQRGASKPRTVKTLSSSINALFQRSLSEAVRAFEGPLEDQRLQCERL